MLPPLVSQWIWPGHDPQVPRRHRRLARGLRSIGVALPFWRFGNMRLFAPALQRKMAALLPQYRPHLSDRPHSGRTS